MTRNTRIACYLLLAVGCVLVLLQFFHDRSLWVDEAALGLNIISRDWLGLLRPLADDQVAPPLFLWMAKASSLLVGGDLGLRLPSLLSYLLALWLFFHILEEMKFGVQAKLAALTLFVFNVRLGYHSNELKQYMTDVCVCLALAAVYLQRGLSDFSKARSLALLGSIGIFLSTPSVLILSAVGLGTLWDGLKGERRTIAKLLCWIAIPWTLSLGIYYFAYVHDHPTRNVMLGFWSRADAFAPLHHEAIWAFLGRKGEVLFKEIQLVPTKFANSLVQCVLWIAALSSLIRTRNRRLLCLLLVPPLLHVLLSALRIYPLHERFFLYLYPLSMIGLAYGLNVLLSKVRPKAWAWVIAAPLLLWPPYFFFAKPFPREREEIKQAMSFVQERMIPDDEVYLYHSASFAYAYYQAGGRVNFPKIRIGKNHRKTPSLYLEEIGEISGRTWLLFAHAHPPEEEMIVQELESQGLRRLETLKATGASAYLFAP